MSKCLIIFPCPIVSITTNQVDRFRDYFIPETPVELESMIDTSAQAGAPVEFEKKSIIQ